MAGIHFETASQLLELAQERHLSISELVIENECQSTEASRDEVWQTMSHNLAVMREAVKEGLSGEIRSASGLVGGQARLLEDARLAGKTLSKGLFARAAALALAVSEVNAGMGRIVAAPTAGSAGVLPGALLAAGEELGASQEELIRALFTAAGIGMVIGRRVPLAGAVAGCQAECGSASAMAAAAVTELAGGTPFQAVNAAAIALQNMLGTVCDPVAGLVEIPCIKRNASGAVNALISAEMALAGIINVIPLDEVVMAMDEIGRALPCELRETSGGGLAVTPTGLRIRRQLALDTDVQASRSPGMDENDDG
ncbi:MAG: L-serine ammonia-lyase, iron-sulfur-dependent, subunit alpha [Syntrophothermus sp.]